MSDAENNIVPQPSSNEAVIDQPSKGRLAEAAAKVREMVRKASPEATEPTAEPTPEPETSPEPVAEGAAEAAPAPAPEPPPEQESRLKPSQLREMERRQKAAERHRMEAEKLYREVQAERQRFAADQENLRSERQRLERDRDDLKRWDEEARKAPIQKMAERWGMKPEELAASFADDKANQLSPEIAARFNEFQIRLESESKERQRLETELKTAREKARETYEQRQRDQDLQHDIRMVARDVLQEAGDQFPHFAALPDETRAQRARYMVLAATEMMQKTGDNFSYNDVLEVLEDQAQKEWTSMSSNERLKARYAASPSVAKAKAAAGGSLPAKTAARAPTAKDAASPGESRESTVEERRRAAARKLRELRGER